MKREAWGVIVHFRSCWSRPAVYRWVIFQRQPGDLQRLYVGEAEQLARRVYRYLHPGPSQQTNLRLNAEFSKELKAGNSIILEAVRFEPFRFEEVVFSEADLVDKMVRRYLENLFTMYYAKTGYAALNA